MLIRLSEWASQQGIAYTTAFRWSRTNRVPGLKKSVSGRLYVEVSDAATAGKSIALYGRVSSSDQSDDLDRQMDRLRSFAAGRGWIVTQEVREIGSGLNGRRKKLVRLLQDSEVGTIVVEHRDRLARFGVEYIVAGLSAQGRTVVVMNEGEQKLDIVQDFIDVVTSMCSRIYGQRSAGNRAKAALAATKAIP